MQVSEVGGESKLTKLALTKLNSKQRIFLLRISRGYRTFSTNQLNIFTEIPPNTIAINMNTIKYQYFNLNRIAFQTLFLNTIIQHKAHGWQIRPAEEILHFQVNYTTKQLHPCHKSPFFYWRVPQWNRRVGRFLPHEKKWGVLSVGLQARRLQFWQFPGRAIRNLLHPRLA